MAAQAQPLTKPVVTENSIRVDNAEVPCIHEILVVSR
jgi:hypothetical protein